MAWFDPSQPQDAQTFNYQTQADKIKRQRDFAAQLMASKQPQGQMVPGGPNGFYVAPSMLAQMTPAIQAMIGAYMQNNADKSQGALDKQSQDEFAKQFNGLGAPVRDPNQDGVEAAAQMQRESNRMTGPEAGQMTGDGQSASDAFDAQLRAEQDGPTAQPSPVAPQPEVIAQPIAPVKTVSSKTKKTAAAVLATPPANHEGMTHFGPSGDPADPTSTAGIQAKLAAALGSAGSASSVASLPKLGAPAPVAPAQTPAAMPPMPQASPMPQNPAQTAPQAMPNAQAAPAMPTPQEQPQIPVTSASSPADPYSHAPSQGELISRLIALGNTGPQGQAIASAQLNQLFASKNGRFSTTVHADPVNGGFVKVTTDSQTGNTQVDPITGGSGQKVLETKDTPQGLMERTAAGWRPAVDASGKQIVTNATASDQRAQTEQTVKMGSAANANTSALSAIDSSLARLDRIQQLSHETSVGPLAGHLPNWTAKRQELAALMAQDIFAETKDAVSGAADAGGAPRMAANEFKFMANNGGLSQNMHPEAVDQLIAQQKMRLLRMKQSVSDYGKTLETTAPGGAPARGQKVSASQYGF